MKFNDRIINFLAIASILSITLILWVPLVEGEISDVSTNPEQPTANDDISLLVNGWFPDSCWSYVYGEYKIENNNIDINLYAFDTWYPGLFCMQIIVDYSEDFNIGNLENGTYFVSTTEYRDSLRDPSPRFHSMSFSVHPDNSCSGDFEPDGDVDGSDLAILIGWGGIDIDNFAEDFGRTDCL